MIIMYKQPSKNLFNQIIFKIKIFYSFPLYPISDPKSFEYGLFLLNRNIGQVNYFLEIVEYNKHDLIFIR
jgi:hypothetical protein